MIMNRNGYSVNDEHVEIVLSRLRFTFNRCLLKLKLLPTRTKQCVAFSVLLIVGFCLHPISWMFPEPITAYEPLLDTSKCPACFGSRVCTLFYDGQIKMSGTSKFRMFDYFNSKNVYFAQLTRGDVVIKKMATHNELLDFDNKICQDSNQLKSCNVAHAFPHVTWVLPFNTNPLTCDVLKNTKLVTFSCASGRFLDTMLAHFQEYDKKNELTLSDRLKVLYTSMVNPEPLILQTFPKSEGWPFPQYFGACGRAIVVENGGEPLGCFYHADFSVRVALAYELMMIAEALTYRSNYGLYMTDVSFDNFVVDFNGQVTLIDLEHVVVVDKLDVKARAPKDWDIPHQTQFYDCEEEGRTSTNCLKYQQTEELCNHELSDFNFNAVCRHVLSQYSNLEDYPGGLLHSMPKEASDVWDLEYHLNACANPRPPADRFNAKDKVIWVLKGLKDAHNDDQTLFKDMEMKR